MARIVRSHRLLRVAIALGAVSLAGAAWAGDRYGASDDGASADQYSDGRAYSYSSQRFEGVEAVDPCAAQQRMIGRGCDVAQGGDRRAGRVYEREVVRADDDSDAIDPCAVQHRLVGHGCEDARTERHVVRTYERGENLGYDDAEAIDPCATQARLTGRGCERNERRGYAVERGGAVYRDREVREEGAVYEEVPVRAHEQFDDRYAYVDSCRSAHARLGEACPYDSREHFRSGCCDRYVDERPVWVEERLPDSFFISDGGVGPGIVDYGGGGGGGFVEAGNFGGSGSASASAQASASASLSLAIRIHNHGMTKPHPGKWGGGSWGGSGGGSWGGGHHGGGCGCKK